ncbi:hypothetical protein [Marinobacterium weihaiense]|uniref:Uncharacterized protein n=1 Tax=Marinobacterium weihaiense TaxID=2851016 RepID=A0ABS6MAL3_9GAMM|nr:hypothetical protein [Marinobacterium weihaiense]MBV0933337.1 hypothetical protein [Marinobacterium weihaiense]
MSIEQILVVMFYTLKPYLMLIIMALILLAAAWMIGRGRRGERSSLLLPLSLIAGIAAALAAPVLTGSQLAYVVTTTDWTALAGIGIGVALYVWLLLAPVWRSR